MTSFQLFDLIGEVDDDLLICSQNDFKRKKATLKYRALAACFCVVVIGLFITQLLRNSYPWGGVVIQETTSPSNSGLNPQLDFEDMSLQIIYGANLNLESVNMCDLSEDEFRKKDYVVKYFPMLSDNYVYEKGTHYEIMAGEDAVKNMVRVIFTKKNSPGIYVVTYMDFVPQEKVVYTPEEITKDLIYENSDNVTYMRYNEICVAFYSSGDADGSIWELISLMPKDFS